MRRKREARIKGPPTAWLAGVELKQTAWFASKKGAQLFIRGEIDGWISGPYRYAAGEHKSSDHEGEK